MKDKVVFFSPMCLLDNTSGAAISARTFLEVAAAAGITCKSFTASLFDPGRNLNLVGILGPKAANPEGLGKRFMVLRKGVSHSIFLTKDTQSKEFSPEEQKKFEHSWINWLKKNKPKVVVSFGGSSYTTRLQGHARQQGAQLVHYLGNAEYKATKWFQPSDLVVCPSSFLSEHYKDTIGINAQVLRNIIKTERLDLTTQSDDELLYRRDKGFITFMNPIPHKGLTLFAEIAKMAAQKKPHLKFLVTEGRTNREWLARKKYDLTQMPNIWFMPNHEDVRSIYQRTGIFLLPSFWKEGFARSVQEAQLSGIPVLASRRGGIPEALNGGGMLFDVPKHCLDNYMSKPGPQTVQLWWKQIERLLDDDEYYITESKKAVSSAQEFHPNITSKNAVTFFNNLLTSK